VVISTWTCYEKEWIPLMSLAIIYSRASEGVAAPQVFVETHLTNGLPSLSIVGLPEAAVRESKDRVRGAILNSGFEFPPRRITINLAPADIPKDGGRFDLPIAIGILAASGQLSKDELDQYEFAAELALGGGLRPVNAVLPAAIQAAKQHRKLVVARENGAEATLVENCEVFTPASLLELTAHLNGRQLLDQASAAKQTCMPELSPDFSDVHGQYLAKRAMEIAAAGNHSILLSGPPGSGKTMLAKRLPTILPTMTRQEALETTAIYSVSSKGLGAGDWMRRPVRAPHHTASAVALVGGGSRPMPGEISLAHNGVLFLDELPEFSRHVLEVLREPMESGTISISRAARQAEYPAKFQLVAAMNPCPCGYLGDPAGRCRCSVEQVQRYQSRISGPLMDRIDIQVELEAVPLDTLITNDSSVESSATIRQRVSAARDNQVKRSGIYNSQLSSRQLESVEIAPDAVRRYLATTMDKMGLTARGFHRVLRVARTIADLCGCREVAEVHINEAVRYRCLDRYLKNRA
jgi:magnesium chelatase family protein